MTTTYYDGTNGNVPKVEFEAAENTECCASFPDACAITWEYTSGKCSKKVEGSSSTEQTADQCCLEGWASGTDALKAACNINTLERKFDADKKECTIVATTIYPVMKDTEVIPVVDEECCAHKTSDSDALSKACKPTAPAKNTFAAFKSQDNWDQA